MVVQERLPEDDYLDAITFFGSAESAAMRPESDR
jgi:hypothetical protein